MSDAADRRIAELEAENYRLREENDNRRKWLVRAEKMVHEAEKKLVERDIYEAEQRLPPEQAALIKHLETVERCIEDGPVRYSYAESSECQFCTEWQTGAHTRECAWLALQFDRKPEATMTMVHEHALNEHETWKRRQKPASTATGIREWLVNNIGPLPAPLSAEDALRASMAVRGSQEALARRGTEIHRDMADAMAYGRGTIDVVTSPLVPPGAVYAMQPSTFVLPPEERRPLILGRFPEGSQVVSMTHDNITVDVPVSEVAPPDDEDVP